MPIMWCLAHPKIGERETVETVSLGAAYAAGYWPDLEGLRRNWHRAAQWLPRMDPQRRIAEYANWQRAVELTFGWIRPAAGAAKPQGR